MWNIQKETSLGNIAETFQSVPLLQHIQGKEFVIANETEMRVKNMNDFSGSFQITLGESPKCND